MSARRFLRSHTVPVIAVVALIFAVEQNAAAQQPPNPWSGIAADDARAMNGDVQWEPFGVNLLSPRSLSGDARFVVFVSRAALVPDDMNDNWDVYVRDRQTSELRRVSVSIDGLDPDGVSSWPTISSDGRHIAFLSCATNLVEGDDNGICDAFVHDREQLITTRINTGPNGDQAMIWDAAYVRLSANGRYTLFVSAFPGSSQPQLWLRDRDTDGNGIYDEGGYTSISEIAAPAEPGLQFFNFGYIAMSGDARYVAFTPDVYTLNFQYLGVRLFLHDRETGVTMQVGDNPPDPGAPTYTTQPDLSDAGNLVYASNAPNIVPGDDDSDADMDVFVFNILAGEHRRVQLTHPGAPSLGASRMPAISSDGRYVTFVGVELTPEGYQFSNIYGFDRETSSSYEISAGPDGQRVNRVGEYPSISGDGSAIAFVAGPEVLVDYWGNDGVFVATSIAMAPDAITVANDGAPVTVDVTAPSNTAWSVRIVDRSVESGLLQVTPGNGVGSGTLELSLPPNNTSYDREYLVSVGSEYVTVRQPASPIVFFVDPSMGPLLGGTEVSIYGSGFVDGASVLFGGQPAASVVVENNGAIRAVTPAHGSTEGVDVVVINPSGARGVLESAFWYFDNTPPVITLTITGTAGLDGWYTSDVSAQWSVHDDESPIQYQDCENLLLNYDTPEVRLTCNALSEGGTSSQTLSLKRDSAAPLISVSSPQERIYKQGELALASFSCLDETSRIASCSGTTANGAPLDTSKGGSFVFTVTATDRAGLRSVGHVQYVVKERPIIAWPNPATITYGTALNVAQLNATANVAGTFTYTPAAGTVLGVGTQTLSVTFTPADPGTYLTAFATAVIVVTPAPLTISANSAMKVYGQALPSFSATATEFVNGDSFASLTGSLTFATTATATSAPGSYPLTVGGVSSPNYTIRFASGTLLVTKASTSMILSMTPNPSRPRQDFQLRVEVGVVAPGAGTPIGTVEFHADGELLGTAPLIDGVATLDSRFKRGTYVVTAMYSGDTNFDGTTTTATYSTK